MKYVFHLFSNRESHRKEEERENEQDFNKNCDKSHEITRNSNDN